MIYFRPYEEFNWLSFNKSCRKFVCRKCIVYPSCKIDCDKFFTRVNILETISSYFIYLIVNVISYFILLIFFSFTFRIGLQIIKCIVNYMKS